MRGSGLEGLDGIPSKYNNIIRPLLFADRDDIQDFIQKNNISYREDSSNISDKYMRNKVRHHVLPSMHSADKRAKEGILLSINHLKKSNQLLQFLVHEYTKQWIAKQKNITTIDLSFLENNNVGHELFFQMIKQYGFNMAQCSDILSNKKSTGNRYFSSHHEALTDRGTLLIRQIEDRLKYEWPILIEPPMEFKIDGCSFVFDLMTHSDDFLYVQNTLYLSTEALTFPLTLRPWKAGDSFTPLGMKGKSQKVKDFLINYKLSGFEKEIVLVLEHCGEIIAIPGYRISEKVRINRETKIILSITFTKLTDD